MITALKRIIKSGYISFRRGGIVSWAGVLEVVNALSVITFIILLQGALHFALSSVKDKVDVTIYFNVGAPESEILALKSSLEKLPEVKEISYTSATQALALFRERHASDYPTIQALDEINTNPLGAYLNVRAKEVSQYETIANFLKSDSALVSGSQTIIDKVNYYQNKLVIAKLSSSISDGQKLSFFLMLYLIISSIIITFNTIRLTIFISKEEIGVMRLVGASRMIVQGPFMIQGAIYGVISTVITLIVFWPLTIWLTHHIEYFMVFNIHDYYVAHFFRVFAIILGSGILLGMISSLIAARKYLNK